MVSLSFPSWNRIGEWLSLVESLGRAAQVIGRIRRSRWSPSMRVATVPREQMSVDFTNGLNVIR
jgi:hypothetical protein